MVDTRRWTSADLDAMPEDGKHYEIIDGELYLSRHPNWYHQVSGGRVFAALDYWDRESGAGAASLAPGVIFADDDDVAPDVVWVSQDRLAAVLAEDGKLYGAPDLIVEVLSPGPVNATRDRQVKLKLYSRRGVREYWVINWQRRQVEFYRRADAALQLVGTWLVGDVLQSPMLPGFAYPLSELFAGFPPE